MNLGNQRFQGDVVVRELNGKHWTVVWLLHRDGRYTKAAILHDYLWHEADEGRFNRCDADGISAGRCGSWTCRSCGDG